MPKSDFVFGTFDTSTSAAYYKLQPINFPTPEKDVETFEVPGRSGDLLIDYGSYKNVELTVEIAIDGAAVDSDFITLYDALRAAIMAQNGYQRLEDSLYPNEYRVARAVKCERDQSDTQSGKAVFTFDAKPQRYLTSGDVSQLTPESHMTSQYVMGLGKDILNSTALDMMRVAGVSNYENREYMALNMSAYTAPTDSFKVYYPEGFTSILKPTGGGVYTDRIVLMTCTGSPLIDEAAGQVTTRMVYLSDDMTYEKAIGYMPPPWYVFPMPLQLEVKHLGSVVESLFANYRELIPPDGVVKYSPLIHIYVDGAVSDPNVMTIADSIIGLNTPATVGDSVTLTEFYIDCDTMNAYAQINNVTYNLNRYVTMTGAFTFSGTVKVAITPSIVSAEVLPRWWKI